MNMEILLDVLLQHGIVNNICVKNYENSIDVILLMSDKTTVTISRKHLNDQTFKNFNKAVAKNYEWGERCQAGYLNQK